MLSIAEAYFSLPIKKSNPNQLLNANIFNLLLLKILCKYANFLNFAVLFFYIPINNLSIYGNSY